VTLPIGSYQPWSMTFLDAGNETSTFSGYATLLTAGNIVAQVALWDTFVTATQALCLGTLIKHRFDQEQIVSGLTVPINGAAREIKLLVQWVATGTGRRGVQTLPTLNPALPDYVQNINAHDVVLTTSPTQITDFIAAYDAFVKDPIGAAAVVVAGLKVVGRNI